MDFKNSLYILSFQLTGLCTAQLPNRRSVRGFWLCCIALMYLVLLGVVLVATWQNLNFWFSNRDPVSKLTDVMQLACPVLAHLVCAVESLTRRNKQKKIFRLAFNIDRHLTEIGVDIADENGQLFRQFGVKFLISVVLCTATELSIIYRICCGAWFEHWCGKVGSFIIDRFSDLQFLFHLDYLTSRGKCLNDELANIMETLGGGHNNRLMSYECQSWHMQQRLRKLKYLHNQYFQLMLNVQKRFAWSILATVASNFLCLTVGMYWIYANFYYKTKSSQISSCLHVVSPLVTYFILFWTSERFLGVLGQVCNNVHLLRRGQYDMINNALIKQFSLQGLHINFNMSAVGFFIVNYYTLTDIISSIANYMLVFVSFLPEKLNDPDAIETTTLAPNVTTTQKTV